MVTKALTLVSVIVLGYLMKRSGWVKGSDFGLISTIVLKITLPCAIITGLNSTEVDVASTGLVAFGLAAVVLPQVVAFFVEARNGRRAQAFGVLNVSSFNIGLFAIPYLSAFVGPEAILVASLFDIGNALGIAGVGFAWSVVLAGTEGTRRDAARRVARSIGTNPLIITYVVMLVIRLLDVHVPAPILGFTTLVGGANTFLAMLMIGIAFEARLSRDRYGIVAKYLALRYGLLLLFVLAAWFLLPYPPEIRIAVAMILFAPTAAMVPGLTHERGLDYQVSAFLISCTVIIGIVGMPTVLAILS